MTALIFFILGLLAPADCGPNQTWQWIPEAQIHACTMTYPAKAVNPNA